MSDFETQPQVLAMDEPNYGGYSKNLKELKVGNGQMATDQDGFYLGADKFSEAPFRVDYSGNMTAESGTFSGGIRITEGANVVILLE